MQKKYFNNLNPESTTDTKKFWKTVKNSWTTEKTFFSKTAKLQTLSFLMRTIEQSKIVKRFHIL